MNSRSVRAGTAGWIARAKAETTTFEIGSRSLSGSYSGRLLRIASVIWVLEPPGGWCSHPLGRARPRQHRANYLLPPGFQRPRCQAPTSSSPPKGARRRRTRRPAGREPRAGSDGQDIWIERRRAATSATAPPAQRRPRRANRVAALCARRPGGGCREHSTQRLRGNRSIVDGADNDFSVSCRGPGPAAIAQLEKEVARVDENSESLAQDENRVADIESVEQQQQAAADREEPEGNRHHHFSRALGGDPLHQEAHGEHDLRHVTEQHPPLELGHEDFVQVAADRL